MSLKADIYGGLACVVLASVIGIIVGVNNIPKPPEVKDPEAKNPK